MRSSRFSKRARIGTRRRASRSATRSTVVEDIDALKQLLRRLRNSAMLHIIWRDLNGRSDLAETTRSLTISPTG